MTGKFKLHETVYIRDNSQFNGEKLWIREIKGACYLGNIDGFNVAFYAHELESKEEHKKRLESEKQCSY